MAILECHITKIENHGMCGITFDPDYKLSSYPSANISSLTKNGFNAINIFQYSVDVGLPKFATSQLYSSNIRSLPTTSVECWNNVDKKVIPYAIILYYDTTVGATRAVLYNSLSISVTTPLDAYICGGCSIVW